MSSASTRRQATSAGRPGVRNERQPVEQRSNLRIGRFDENVQPDLVDVRIRERPACGSNGIRRDRQRPRLPVGQSRVVPKCRRRDGPGAFRVLALDGGEHELAADREDRRVIGRRQPPRLGLALEDRRTVRQRSRGGGRVADDQRHGDDSCNGEHPAGRDEPTSTSRRREEAGCRRRLPFWTVHGATGAPRTSQEARREGSSSPSTGL